MSWLDFPWDSLELPRDPPRDPRRDPFFRADRLLALALRARFSALWRGMNKIPTSQIEEPEVLARGDEHTDVNLHFRATIFGQEHNAK